MVTTVDAITSPVPSKASPSNFSARADQFLGELPVFQSQINALSSELNVIGATAENAIIASAAAVTAANYKGNWNAGRTYAVGDSVTYEGFSYSSKVDSNLGVEPDSDPTKWLPVITDRVGEIKYTFEAPGGTWKLCDGSLSPIADADGNFAATLNNAQKFVYPGKITDPSFSPAALNDVDWTDNSSHVVYADTSTPFLYVFRRDGDILTKLDDPSVLPPLVNSVQSCGISGDGGYVAVGGQSGDKIAFYKIVGDVISKITNPATMPLAAISISWTSTGTYCAVGSNDGGIGAEVLMIYKRTGDTLTKLSAPSTEPTTACSSVVFSQDDSILAAYGTGDSGTLIYDRTGDVFDYVETIASINVRSMSADGEYIVGIGSTDAFDVLKRVDGVYVSLLAPDYPTDVTSITDVAISPDAKNIVIVGTDAPYIARYRIVNDKLVKLNNEMDDMPSAGISCATFSGDNNFLSAGLSTYKPTNYDETAYFRVPYIEPVDKDGLTLEGLNAYLKVGYGGLLNPPAQWADGLLQSVGTLAELQGLDPADYSGQERRVTGVGIFESNGTSWAPVDFELTPEMFGCVGDGVTFDTVNFQAWLDFAPNDSTLNATRGKNYLIGNVQLSNKENVTVSGYGATLTLQGAGVNGLGIELVGTFAGCTVRGFKIVGDGVKANKHKGIWSNSGQNLVDLDIYHNKIYNVVNGISLNSNLGGTIVGGKIHDNYIYNVVGIASGEGYGIHVAKQGGTSATTEIYNNHIHRAGRHSIYAARGSNIDVHHNWVYDHRGALTAAEIADGTDGRGKNRPAIGVYRSSFVNVEHNHIVLPYDGSITINKVSDGESQVDVCADHNTIYYPQNAVPSIVVGSFDPSIDGFNRRIFVRKNVGISDGINIELITFYSGKDVHIEDNSLQLLNATATTRCVFVYAKAETAGTANYSDNVNIKRNKLYGTNGAGGNVRGIRLDATMLQSSVGLNIEANETSGDIVVPILKAVALANPNYREYISGGHCVGLYTAGATTIDVSKGIDAVIVANSVATSITNLTGFVDGQVVTLEFRDSNTTLKQAAVGEFVLAGAVDFVSTINDTITLVYLGGKWREVARSLN